MVWKVTFLSSPQEPNVYNVRRKEPGILGIPGMQPPSKRSFPFQSCSSRTHSPNSAPQQGFPNTKVETQNLEAGAQKELSNRGLHINLSFNRTKNLKAKNGKKVKVT